MKCLKLKLYQNLCNYRKEGSFGYVQTYPLPTPSMVRGMVHSILELNEYHPIVVGIQGKSDAVLTNIQKVFKFDRDPKSRPLNPYVIEVKKSIKTATHGILYIDLLINIRLVLHISFVENNETMCNKLYDKIKNSILTLGRNEDLALIENIKIVNLGKFTERQAQSKFPMYVKTGDLVDDVGTKYRLPFWYEFVSSFEENRIFHHIDVNYVLDGVRLRNDSIYQDDDGDIVSILG